MAGQMLEYSLLPYLADEKIRNESTFSIDTARFVLISSGSICLMNKKKGWKEEEEAKLSSRIW